MAKYSLFRNKQEMDSAVPEGKRLLLRLGDEEAFLLRHQNSFFVVRNLCPHLGHPLKEGKINHSEELVCPLHFYRFSLKTGEESLGRCNPLEFKKLVIPESGEVYVIT